MSAGELEGACGAGFAVLSLGFLLVGALMEAVEGAVLAAVLLVLGMARRAGAAAGHGKGGSQEQQGGGKAAFGVS